MDCNKFRYCIIVIIVFLYRAAVTEHAHVHAHNLGHTFENMDMNPVYDYPGIVRPEVHPPAPEERREGSP